MSTYLIAGYGKIIRKLRDFMKKKNPFFLILSLLLVLFLAAPAMAQGTQVFDRLEIQFWPEYDRPGVLVIYHLTLSAQTSLPAQFQFSLPLSAIKPETVAYLSWDGLLYDLDYDLIQVGDHLAVSFITPFPEIQIEYYDPNLLINSDQRDFTFSWLGDYSIEDMIMIFQQPSEARNFAIEPGFLLTFKTLGGINYYTANIGRINAGDSFDIHFSYQRPIDSLSTPLLAVQPSSDLNLDALTDRWNIDSLVPSQLTHNLGWITIIIILASVLVMAITLMVVSGFLRPMKGEVRARIKARLRKQSVNPTNLTTQQPIYCQQCGRKAQAGDIFCRSCGTRYPTG